METKRGFLLATTIAITTIAGCGAPRNVAWIQRGGIEQRYVIPRVITADEIATRIQTYRKHTKVTIWRESGYDLVFIGRPDNVQLLFRVESDGSTTRMRTYAQERWFEKAMRETAIGPVGQGQ